MNNTTQIKRKWTFFVAIAIVAVIFIAALVCGICVSDDFDVKSAQTSNGLQASNSVSATDNVAAEYTYGQTYTVNGQDYTLGKDEGMDYKTALGLAGNVARIGDGYNVTLKSFTYFDGSDGTAETNSVRNAGTYVFNVTPALESGVSEYTVRVNREGLDFSTVDWIPVFVNTGSPYYKAHGDITSVYKHNDGWYPSQKANEVPVEIRTITNAYYYETHNTDKSNLISIKIANEKLTGVENKPAGDLTDAEKQITTSTLKYNDDLTFNITDRAGVAFTTSNEYIATFTFHIPEEKQNNYYFDYGTKTEDDEISDSNKGLSITQRTEDSFVLSKHWFIVKSADLFMAVGDTASFPYVPFHDNAKLAAANGLTNITEGNIEGIRGETNTATDTVKYAEAFTVKPPIVKLGSEDGTINFDVTYVDLSGTKHKIATDVALDTTITYDTDGQTIKEAHCNIEQYFNETMPAGRYTLKLYGIRGSDKIIGEYWLTVLPKEIDSEKIGAFQDAINVNNSYALGANKIHEDLSNSPLGNAYAALNGSLNNTLGDKTSETSYWVGKSQFFDDAVTIMYNLNTWSSSNYVTYADMVGMLSTYGTYTVYYSISAKNYVTIGGANDVNRTSYTFNTELYSTVKVSDIYKDLIDPSVPYFSDVTFNGGEAKTSVPQNSVYIESFNDVEYVNVGRHSVTLTLRDAQTNWDKTLPDGVNFDDYFELDDTNKVLTVYFNIVAADNSWNVMPQMPSWSFNSFDKNINSITAGLRFNSTVKYALIPNTVTNPNSIEWGIEVDGELTSGKKDGIVYFTVDKNGAVDDTTAALLNSLKPASYYLKFFVSEVTVIVTNDETTNEVVNVNAYNDIARNSAGNPLANITVSKAINSWTETPNVMTWIWGSYDSDRNSISASATYPALKPTYGNNVDESFVYTNGGAALPVITFSIRKMGDIAPIEGLESFTAVDGTIATILETLHAGKYELTTSVGGSDYYTEIAETKLTFAIAQAVNSWTTTPQVVQWTWGNYSADRNKISAATKFTGGDGSQENSNDKPILFTVLQVVKGSRVAVTNLESFQVGSDGKITNSSAAAAFAALHAGSYYLRAEKLGNNDYTDIIGSDSTDIPFSVAQATATWQTAPRVIGWTYGEFDARYFTAGVPTFYETKDEDGNPVKVEYTLAKLGYDASTVDTFTEFSEDYFKNLNAGSYTLTAFYAGTGDYGDLNSEVSFTVAKYTNSWNPSPSLRGWTYRNFTAGLFTAGVPTRQDDENATVTYVVNGGKLTSDVTLTVNADGTLTTNSIQSLTALAAGSYKLIATYPKTDNYDAINASIDFEVTKIANSWATTPSVIGWIYGSFDDSYFTAGVPTYFESKDDDGNLLAVEYTLTKTDDEHFTPVKFTSLSKSDFDNLNAGSYRFDVKYAASDNYDELPAVVTFTVGKCVNTWNTSPGLRSWDYKTFTSSLFTAGVPRITNSVENDKPAVVKYVVTGGKLTSGVALTVDERGALSDISVNFLTSLPVGSYKLHVTYVGTVNYDALTLSIDFDVFIIENSWSTKPRMIGWTYGSFDSGYFIAGVPALQESKDQDGNPAVVTYLIIGGKLDESGMTLAVNADGTLSTDSVNFLTALSAGSYTLYVSYVGTDNYEGLDAEDTVVTFRVLQVTSNNWKNGVSPDISGWTYGDFTKDLFTNGTPEHGEVSYTLVGTLSNGNAFARKTFTTDDDKSAYAKVQAQLALLNAGAYTLEATSGSTPDYSAIEWSKQFVVAKADNEWATEPSISNWTYGNAASALNSYAVKYEHEEAVITRQCYKADDNGNPIGNALDSVNAAGSYAYVITVNDTINYNGFTATLLFTVYKAANAWNTLPESSYTWTLDNENNSSITQPTLKHTNNGECVVTYTLVKVGGTGTLYSGAVWSSADSTNSLINILKAQKAGTYEITAAASSSTENYDLPTNIVFTVTVNTKSNSWKTIPSSTVTWIYNGSGNTKIEFEAENNASLKITVGGDEISATNLNTTLQQNYGVGSYTIVAYVPSTDEYSELEATITLVITRATDSFGEFNVPQSWGWDDVSQKTDENGVAWQTNWNVNLKVPVPTVSMTATAIVYSGEAEELAVTLHYETIDGLKKVLTTDLNALKTKLLGLHVGNYTIKFIVADSPNYTGCDVSEEFSVTKVNNAWDGSDGAPKIAGWQYDGSVANPTATPKYGKGTVKFSYAKVLGNETIDDIKANNVVLTWNDGTDTAGGSYWLRAEVPGTDDYNYLVGYCKFNISAGQNGWVNNPGVIAWNWNSYSKTVNLFSGSAKNNGVATFKIFAGTEGNNRNLALTDFVPYGYTLEGTDETMRNLFCINGFTLTNVNNVMVVSDEVKNWLNALKPGTYLLSVTVADDNNYDSITGTATFVVGKAANSWATGKAPAVSSYVYGELAENTFTHGETVYGAASAVTYRLEGTTFATETFTSTEGGKAAYVKLQERLATLEAGNYTLSAWVVEVVNGTYSALYSSNSPYTTRSFTVIRATNGWTNETIVTQVNKPYSVLHDEKFNLTEFAKLYAQLIPIEGKVNYALLNADYSSRGTDTLDYNGLFTQIMALPAGEYVIRATVDEKETKNYTAISATDTRLTISKHDNAFIDLPDSLTAQWAREGDEYNNVNKSVLTDFEIKATYGASTVTFTLQNVTLPEEYQGKLDYSTFKSAVQTLNAGSYNVLVEIAGTDDYAGLSAVLMLVVGTGTNSWQNDWTINTSLIVSDSATLKWTWGSAVNWLNAQPVYGNTVYVEIRKEGATSASHYITLDYSKDITTTLGNIKDALSGLDAGTYTLTVTAPATVNWKELKKEITFVVDVADTVWTTLPSVSGATKTGDFSYQWSYGTVNVSLSAAVNTKATVKYYMDGKELSALPTNAGSYVIKFVVAATTNYNGISQDVNVNISKASLSSFAEGVSITGWTWNTFNRVTNRFVAVPNSLGAVTFTVLDKNQKVAKVSGTLLDKDGKVVEVITDKELANITLTNVDGRPVVSERWAQLLNLLTADTYTLRVDVAETDNYNGFTNEKTSFIVSAATNTWTTTPSVAPWSLNAWKSSENTPVAEARYGHYEIFIKADINNEVFYHEYFDEVQGKYVAVNDLNAAPIGWYTMTAIVKKADGKYDNGQGEDLTGSMRFQIFVKGSPDIKNHWVEIPSIIGWTANLDGEFNMPVAEPARGRTYFEFFKAVKNAKGEYELGDQVTEKDMVIKVLNTDNIYAQEWFVPVEPGFYFLVAHAVVSGVDDDLETRVQQPFEISKRTNVFVEEPRIDTLLYLGDRANWAAPTATALEGNENKVFKYVNKDTGEQLDSMPNKEGTYWLIVTVEATFCNKLESKPVEFTVELSPNTWTIAPNIKDWSEENESSLPIGAASVGSDEIKYTYKNLDTGEDLGSKKPTTEGSYVMYADLKPDGYELLHAEYYFTIEPAFDTDMLVVDLILGLVACALAVFVIIFAVKRYREN